MPHCDHTPYAHDVIVVLGAAVWPGGRPSYALERRVAHAVHLFQAKQARVLLMTGGLGRHPPHEAYLMRDLALTQGVPAQSIELEDHATSTFESGAYCAPIFAQRGWTTALIVTDSYHLPRAILTFRSFGIRATGSAAPYRWRFRNSLKRLRMYGREVVACLWYGWLILAWRLRRGGKYGKRGA